MLERIITEEEGRRIHDASYFNKIKEVYNNALNTEKERQKLGFPTQFEFAVYGLLQSIKDDQKASKDITNAIYNKVKEEAEIVGWKNKRSSEKKISIAIYDILSENGYPEEKTNELTMQIIDLAKVKYSLQVDTIFLLHRVKDRFLVTSLQANLDNIGYEVILGEDKSEPGTLLEQKF